LKSRLAFRFPTVNNVNDLFWICLAENTGVEPEVWRRERALNLGFNSLNLATLRFSLLKPSNSENQFLTLLVHCGCRSIWANITGVGDVSAASPNRHFLRVTVHVVPRLSPSTDGWPVSDDSAGASPVSRVELEVRCGRRASNPWFELRSAARSGLRDSHTV